MPRFLIADDSAGKADFLASVIKHEGMDTTIVFAKTTEQAKEMIDTHDDIAFAFVDYEIPSENGPPVISYLKERQPHARIALVTSANSDVYERDGMEAGAEAFICTSFEQDTVIKNLSELLMRWNATL